MTISIAHHKVIRVEQLVNKFNDFTAYMFIGTNEKGEELCVEFYHDHRTTLLFDPVLHADYSTNEENEYAIQ